MSTRSVIGVVRSSESGRRSAEAIHSQSDGYPEYTGRLLEGAYPKLEDAERILSLGSVSTLG